MEDLFGFFGLVEVGDCPKRRSRGSVMRCPDPSRLAASALGGHPLSPSWFGGPVPCDPVECRLSWACYVRALSNSFRRSTSPLYCHKSGAIMELIRIWHSRIRVWSSSVVDSIGSRRSLWEAHLPKRSPSSRFSRATSPRIKPPLMGFRNISFER